MHVEHLGVDETVIGPVDCWALPWISKPVFLRVEDETLTPVARIQGEPRPANCLLSEPYVFLEQDSRCALFRNRHWRLTKSLLCRVLPDVASFQLEAQVLAERTLQLAGGRVLTLGDQSRLVAENSPSETTCHLALRMEPAGLRSDWTLVRLKNVTVFDVIGVFFDPASPESWIEIGNHLFLNAVGRSLSKQLNVPFVTALEEN